MKKKSLIIIAVVVLSTMIVGTSTALANGNQGATLEEKLIAIEERVDEESMTREEADAIIEQITSCDGDCDESEECTNRPEEGRGIFGRGAQDGEGFKNGNGLNQKNGQGQGQGQGKNRTND